MCFEKVKSTKSLDGTCMIKRTFYNKLVVILREAEKRRPKNLARLSEEKTVRENLRSRWPLRMTKGKVVV
jgi:hypothetical protein